MVLETNVRPDVIRFEWVHLRPAEKAASARRLVEQGYRDLTIGRDAIAVRPASIEAGVIAAPGSGDGITDSNPPAGSSC